MTRRVTRPAIGLYFGDPQDDPAALQVLADEVSCDLDGTARKESPREESHCRPIMHLSTAADLE
jgi:hypothetical protein